MGLHLSESEIAALENRTEGWIAGLQLAALSMQGRSNLSTFVQAFTGSHRFVLDYLMDEVLQRQPVHIQQFLLQTALLERMSGSLCEALLQETNAQETLEYLERSNLFLIPLDDERQWYRYHTLFRDVLRARLQATLRASMPELHRRAGRWYEQHQFQADAIHHTLAAQDFTEAARRIEVYADTIWMSGELSTLIGWLAALPEPILHAHLRLCLIYAWVLYLTIRGSTADTLMQYVEHALADETPSSVTQEERAELLGMMAAIEATLAVMKGEGARVMELSQKALACLPAERSLWRVIPAINLGFAYQSIGAIPEAHKAFAEARVAALTQHNRYFAIIATCGLANIHIFEAKLHQAQTVYLQAQELMESMGGNLPTAGYIDIGLGGIESEWNHLEAAEIALQRGLEKARQWKVGDIGLYGNVLLAYVQIAQHNRSGATQSLHRAEEIAQNIGSSLDNLTVMALKVRLWLLEGNMDEAARWAQERIFSKETLNYREEVGHLALVRVYIAQGKYAQALEMLALMLPLAEQAQRPSSSIDILTVQVVALEAAGHTPQAVQALSRLLALTRAEGYVRMYVDEGKPIQRLLVRLLAEQQQHNTQENAPSIQYLRTLLAAFNSKSAEIPIEKLAPTTAQPLIEPLSERELEVLHMLAHGDSNQEIADTLVISLSTVKKHVSNVLAKLTVTSRTQAILRARELRLI